MIHPIQNGCLRVEVAEHGAELQSIRDTDGTEYLWQGDGTYWSDRAHCLCLSEGFISLFNLRKLRYNHSISLKWRTGNEK